MPALPRLSDVLAASKTIAKMTVPTPLFASALSGITGFPVWLKLETLHPTGSFKLRGATNAIGEISKEQRERGVVCCSTGNHGRALAFVARENGVKATICLSKLVSEEKVRAVESLGAQVVRIGVSQDEAQQETNRLVTAEGLIDIPPFDNFGVIAGQGTIGLELLADRPELETILVPLSGGGLISGIAIAAKTIKPSIRIVGISMERGAAMAESLLAGKPVEVEEVASLADSLGGGIGLNNRYTFSMCRDLVDDVVLLTEEEIFRGMQSVFFEDRLVAEGSSAVGHGAILAGHIRPEGPTAIIISGQNVDMKQFADVMRTSGIS